MRSVLMLPSLERIPLVLSESPLVLSDADEHL